MWYNGLEPDDNFTFPIVLRLPAEGGGWWGGQEEESLGRNFKFHNFVFFKTPCM